MDAYNLMIMLQTDKASIVGEAIGYIKTLEDVVQKLETIKTERVRAHQWAAAAAAPWQPTAAARVLSLSLSAAAPRHRRHSRRRRACAGGGGGERAGAAEEGGGADAADVVGAEHHADDGRRGRVHQHVPPAAEGVLHHGGVRPGEAPDRRRHLHHLRRP